MTLPPHLHYDEESDRERQQRLNNKLRRLGTQTPECMRSDCNETDPFAMTGVYPEILCYEHERIADGFEPFEDDHPAGRRNDDTTLRTPGNDHRWLTDLQEDWPERTRLNPDDSPLLRIAAILRRWLDLLWLFIKRLMVWTPKAVEELDRLLTEHIGRFWWDTIGWEIA